VLLLIMNWFFHRVYWSEWIGRFHRRRRELLADERRGFFSAQVLGLALLGLTSVYREGFETVLFLQSLELSAGTVTVLEGAGLGLAATFLVAVFTFSLQRKLPYKKMLIVTGVLLAFVLVVMVGQTARTCRARAGCRSRRPRSTCRIGRGSGSASSRRGRRGARRSSPSPS
jgi:high-affinity iron transporter